MRGSCAALLISLTAIGCSPSDSSDDAGDITLQGCGATFPAPLYKRWFLGYYQQHPDVRVNYTAIGSGAGIRQFSSEALNIRFGASDAGISKEQISKLPESYGGVVVLPMTAGSIVLSYNLPGVTAQVRLNRETYLKIFLNQITNWSDEAIAKSNPGANLPDSAITLVRRADSSGTSYAFSNHMNTVAKAVGVEWTPGVSTSPKWGESIAAAGNDGIAALLQLTPGSIGYLEYGYAELAHLPMASLENYAAKFVPPSTETGRKALEGAKIPDDLQIKVPDPSVNPDAYPIVTYTWILCRKHYKTNKQAATLRSVLLFSLEDRQQEIAEQLGYIRLPKDVIDKVRKAVANIAVAP